MDGSKPRPIFPQDVHGAIGAHAAPVVVNLPRRATFGCYLTRLVAAAGRPVLSLRVRKQPTGRYNRPRIWPQHRSEHTCGGKTPTDGSPNKRNL